MMPCEATKDLGRTARGLELQHQAFVELEFRARWGCVKQELILTLVFVNALVRQMCEMERLGSQHT